MTAMTTDTTDTSAYLRGKLWVHGIRDNTPLPVLLDVLTTLVVDVPRETLEDWRSRFDAALAGTLLPDPTPTVTPQPSRPAARGHEVADRETWGLLPHHQADLGRLMRTVAGEG